ncbi:MAG: sensor of ECF-type sigma factor [Lacinutrix sp.]|uniref:sensor of ECF-type sigma factor n=1 Tax=Lacinutrix sp. TaxID=1937692 RepID=UPI0030B43988
MKNILIPIIALLLSVSAYAQKPNKEKMKALKVAHITEELDLTAKEAQAFWPIYNAHEEANDKLIKNSDLKRLENIDGITEDEAKAHLDKIVQMEISRQKIQKEYYSKLSAVLSSKKILKLMNTERSFRRKMIKEFKERHRGDKSKRQ